ncbi:MAG: hypothetical protein DMF91_03550 [Acidobacteria bacterium]|nr:MAG: hypothetical protein DMF91_03550 [Acidobacteriota bacterium]
MTTRKRRLLICGCVAATLIVITLMRTSAFQSDDLDVLKVIPENYTLVLDNSFVRVLEARIPAGAEEKPTWNRVLERGQPASGPKCRHHDEPHDPHRVEVLRHMPGTFRSAALGAMVVLAAIPAVGYNGLALILAGHAGGMKTGMHSKMRNTIGDLYLTVAEEVFKLPLEKGFPTAEKKISGIV